MNKVIAVDFDGTLCQSKWPDIGEENTGLIEWLKECKKNGDKLILFTCREGMLLRAAIMWCLARDLEFDAVNDNCRNGWKNTVETAGKSLRISTWTTGPLAFTIRRNKASSMCKAQRECL